MTDADTETEAKTDAETNAAQAEKEAAEREALKAETVANAMKGTWLSISDAAKKYGKKPTRQTITTWIRDEIIPAAAVKRDGPRKVFVEASELDRVIESWKAERKSKASTNIMTPGREDAAAIAELKSEVDKLKAEVASKDALLAAKDETIEVQNRAMRLIEDQRKGFFGKLFS
jgi:hypothetical protein